MKKTDISLLITVWSMLFFYAVYFVIEGQARYNFPILFLMLICFGWLVERFLIGAKEQDTSAFGGKSYDKKVVKKRR